MSENSLKFRIFRMLRSPLRSCKSKDQISDVVSSLHRPKHHKAVKKLFSPKPHSPPPPPAAEETHFITKKTTASILSPDVSGRKCPRASPVNNNFYDFSKQKKKKTKSKKKKGRSITYRKCAGFEDRFPDCKYVNSNGLFISSDDEDDDVVEEEEAAVAVVKRSSDPYNDFKTSMMEMIVEKHIYAAKDLENLLRCFLSLNSNHHHRVIIQVFVEIWEAIFVAGIILK